MKQLKRILSLALATVLCLTAVLVFASCSGKTTYTVGIIQLVQHPALDAATEGFKQALIDRLGEDNVTFDYQNASNDTTQCATIASTFVSKNVDLIMANATPALQAAVNATSSIPILGTSITDYGTALGNAAITDLVGGNVSGTCDIAPLEDQAKMILELFPQAKKVAMLYCNAEPNSDFQVGKVTAYLESQGVTCVKKTFTDSNDIVATAQAIVAEQFDVVYIPTDNTAASCTEAIDGVLRPARVPVVAGEEAICKACGVATLSISYYSLGYKTGEMAADILEGKANISEMKIAYDPNAPVKKYNGEICTALGITPPEGYEAIVFEDE